MKREVLKPVCSVCIANYNGRNVLEACLDSVFQQDFPCPIEVIVHDDASTDGSADIVPDKFPNVKLMRSNRNVGFCVSNNRMVAAAKGSFILLLNNDAELHNDALATLYNAAVGENKYAIIGLPQYDMQTGELIDIGNLFDPFLNPIPNKDKTRRNVGMVIGACMWLPKDLWNELGGFPEWFESNAEDMYLCCLARLKGYPVIALSASGYNHWVGNSFGGGKVVHSTLQTTYRRRALSERNKSYVMFLCYPDLMLYLLLPLHLVLLAAEGMLLCLVKRNALIWKNIYGPVFKALWSEKSRLIRERKKIQENRRISLRRLLSSFICCPFKLKMLLLHGVPRIR